MKIIYKRLFFLIFLIILCGPNKLLAFNDSWPKLKGKHFVVQYQSPADSQFASEVLRKAEDYYHNIGSKIGYARYGNFWTWDDRVQIIMYESQDEFMSQTGAPAWAKGGAIRDENLFRTRLIITYKQEDGFLDGVLPHEICHLIVRDFIGFDKPIPVWFEEGLAQLHETGKVELADQLSRKLISQEQFIPLEILMRADIRSETDPLKVSIFYAQSVSILDFLIKTYGSRKFGNMCHNLKEGRNFEQAMRKAYRPVIETIEDLERKWVGYIKSK